MRSLLLLQVTALQYRRQRIIADLPPNIAEAQRAFDQSVTGSLQHLADPRIREPEQTPEESSQRLSREIHAFYQTETGERLSPAADAILALSASMVTALHSLNEAAVR